MATRVMIDTDPGIDDTAAILLALASPELEIVALTTVYGNGAVRDCTRNALTIVDAAGRTDIPIYAGASKPLVRNLSLGYHVHGPNAFGGIDYPIPVHAARPEHAALAMIQEVMSHPGETVLLALGPLTTVALAMSLEPRLAENVREVVIMGGAVLTYGNASEAASANLYYDPEAAAIVYGSGARIVQIGLDVCRRVYFTRTDIERLELANLPTTNMLAQITPFLAGFYRRNRTFPRDGHVSFNDVPAVAYLLAPQIYDLESYYVRIALHDELTRGATVADVMRLRDQPPNVQVALNVDVPALKELFIKRVTQERNR